MSMPTSSPAEVKGYVLFCSIILVRIHDFDQSWGSSVAWFEFYVLQKVVVDKKSNGLR